VVEDASSLLSRHVATHASGSAPKNTAPVLDILVALRDRAVEFHEYEAHPETFGSDERLTELLRWEGGDGSVTPWSRLWAAQLRVELLEAQLCEALAALDEVGEGPVEDGPLQGLRRRPVVTEVDIIVDVTGEAWASVATGVAPAAWRCTGHRPWQIRDGDWWPSPQPDGSRFPDDDLPRLSWFWARAGDGWQLRDGNRGH
jgi:hypothetical protein